MVQFRYSALSLLFVTSTTAQAAGSICAWIQPRAGVVRDTLYFDGGQLSSAPTEGFCEPNGVSQSRFNFSTSFNQTTNWTNLLNFTTITTGTNLYDPHLSGYMFADDEEWYAFGGMSTSFIDNTTENTGIIWDGVYQPDGVATLAPVTATGDYKASGNFTYKYITNGGGVNIPSESLGIYFGGLTTPNNSDIGFVGNTILGQENFPSKLVDTMLVVDTKSYEHASFTELPVPNGTARAEATLAWIPIGKRGALIVMGGVDYPADIFGDFECSLNASYTPLNARAPSYMTNISVYDIDGGTWYAQRTNGDSPPQLAQACAVVASAPDNTSHNIYVYGGYAGGVNGSDASDDVWILSVPAFTWIQVKSNDQSHARSGHVCAKPYPDQMMVLGGGTKCRGQLADGAPFADIFNLVSLKWTGGYDPLIWSNYTVPTQVDRAILSRVAANMDPNLQALFKTTYTGKHAQYWPYHVTQPNGTVVTPAPQPGPSQEPGHSGRPGWMIPVAVVVPIVVVLFIIVAVIFCIRRKRKGDSVQNKQSRISSWILGQKSGKSLRSDDDTTLGASPGIHEALGDSYFKTGQMATVAELNSPFHSPTRDTHGYNNRQTAELHSHSSPAELPTDVRNNSSSTSPYIRNHPLYPPNIDGRASTNQTKSVSSPDAITPYELVENRSNEKILPPVPDMVLNQVQPHSPRIVPSSTNTHSANVTNVHTDGGDVSPELHPVDDDNFPNDPPTRLLSDEATMANTGLTHRPSHQRNTSSLSDISAGGSPDREHHNRSINISPVPGSPTTIQTSSPRSPTPGSRPSSGTPRTSNIRRKEIGSGRETPVPE